MSAMRPHGSAPLLQLRTMGRMSCLLALLAACSGEPSETGVDNEDTSGPDRPEGEDSTVVVFAEEYIHYGAENRRSVDVTIELPDGEATYSEVLGRFALTCPNDRCDHWDRYGTFGVVLNAGTDEEAYLELDRFITPYRVGFSWESPLIDVLPLLTGTQTFRVFIDTWITEGSSSGDGWLFTAEFDYVGGPPPSPEPVAVTPVWGHLSWYAGLDDSPVEEQVVPTTVALPSDATQHIFRSFITGHGWNNTQNCAEFCSKEHFYTVGPSGEEGTEFGREVWRDDCSETETDGRQQGTWRYSRAGWCPGAQVYPWDTDATDLPGGSTEVDISYRLQDFTWFGDGDQPYYYMSGTLISYR